MLAAELPRLDRLVLVLNSCEPLTASVEGADSVPAERLVNFCEAPGAAPVPPAATKAISSAVAVRCTTPSAPVATLVLRLLRSLSTAPMALPTLL